MTTRHRTNSSLRKDYGLWRPNDGSDSERPRHTMATTQRHTLDQVGDAEALRKHRSSRRTDPTDPLDPSTSYPRHKSSSKDRSSSAHQASFYAAPTSQNPSVQLQLNAAHYDLRAYLKQKTERRSPRAADEKGLVADEAKPSRSGQRSRHAYPNSATAANSTYTNPAIQPISARDPASSSRHHRERNKDREKPSTRVQEKVKTRDRTAESSDDKDRQRRKEKDGDGARERSSRDKERHREKDRHKDSKAQTATGTHSANAANAYQTKAQPATVPHKSTERTPASYTDITRAPSGQPHSSAAPPPASAPTGLPWSDLTSTGRGGAVPVPESAYPYMSDKDDPPIPIPPPGRGRTSSKAPRSHQKLVSQQAGQDSGLSSSEQEHERSRIPDRHYASREQASIYQRRHSSGPSGSENEKVPTIQTERRKHRTQESSRHKSKTGGSEPQTTAEHTTSQEIANQWYQRHQRDLSVSRKQAPTTTDATGHNPASVHSSAVQAYIVSMPPPGKPTSSVGLTVSQRVPHIVSIRAGQGPADPHTLPKVIHSGVTPLQQTDPLPLSPYQPAASRQQDVSLQTTLTHNYSNTFTDASPDAFGSNQQPGYSYFGPVQPRSIDHRGGPTMPGGQQLIPDVVIRPPSTRPPSAPPAPLEPRSSRSRLTPAPNMQSAGYTQVHAQPDGDANAPHSSHVRTLSQDLPSKFPVHEDTAVTRPSGSGSMQHPSASPKRGSTYPGASAPLHVSTGHVPTPHYLGGSHDPRSQKSLPVKTDISRQQTQASGVPLAIPHAASTSSSTPKHTSSVRLHSHRNGSNDTMTQYAPTKPSPSGSSQQQLPRRTSAGSLQPQPHSSTSRIDPNANSRQLNAYPDVIRYRSPAPQTQGYPNVYSPMPAPINVAAPSHSHSYSTQTPLASHDFQQYSRTMPTSNQTSLTAQNTQTRTGQSADESFLGSHSLASPAPSAQRVPPRAAPSPAPTTRPPRHNAFSSPSTQLPPQSAPSRNQTFSSAGPNDSVVPPLSTAHSRTISDPQYGGGRNGTAYASASLPTRGRKAVMTQQDILLTPSSLAPSMLPQTSAPFIPLDRSTSKNSVSGENKEKKRSFFGSLFRSRSSPPKERNETPVPPSQQYREKRERNISQPTLPTSYTPAAPNDAKPLNGVPTSSNRVATHTGSAAIHPAPPPTHQRGHSTGAVPIAQPAPASIGRNTNGKTFTPFRLLSKRHHTVSTASVEAVEGTVITAMLTGGDSTRSSTAGRPSPPLRDPLQAAHDWRTREEWLQQDRGKLRRRRPGVTFDVGEEVPEDGRPSLQKTMRANMAAMAAAQVQQPQSA